MIFSSLTLDLDFTYFLVLALLLLPLLILNFVLFPPFLKLSERRHDAIVGAIGRADQRLKDAEEKAHTFEEKIRIATQQGLDARNAIRAEAQRVMAERIAQEKQRLAGKLEAAVSEIRSARSTAMASTEAEARKLAQAAAAKLLGRGVES